ncbi:MAG: EAL and HDOD domain-containing protein, partial [Deefgea sp.]
PLGGQLPASFMRLNLALQQAQAGAPFAEIAETIRVDPALSTRLLRYVNSAAFGLNHPIHHLLDALNLLGQQRLYRWLALLFFNPSSSTPLDDTLLEAALTRARLMELLGEKHTNPAQCELLFLTGLFSLLDYLLRVPRALLLSELKMPELVAQTLAGRSTELSPYLNVAIQSEQGEMPSASDLAQCHCDAAQFNQRQLEATMWALTTLSS